MRSPGLALTPLLLVAGALALAQPGRAQILIQGFDDVAALPAAGWIFVDAPGEIPVAWFRGNSGVFPALTGAPSSYIAQNFLSPGFSSGNGSWMITPVLPLVGGEILSFRTRAELVPGPPFRDGLSVLLGVGPTASLANFTTGLVELGPVLGSGPYPTTWQFYGVEIPTVVGMTSGRIAFRYFVEDASEASYIGIDSVTVAAALPDADDDDVPDPADNCPTVSNANQADGAGGLEAPVDGVGDACDSCVRHFNPRVWPTLAASAAAYVAGNPWATLTGGQRDDDRDGFGNRCDADFTATGITVGPDDLLQYRTASAKSRSSLTACGSPTGQPCAEFDLNESGNVIGPDDLNTFRALNGKLPGPKCPTCPLTCESGSAASCF